MLGREDVEDLKRKVALIGMLVVSFLVGASFNFNYVALGNGDSKPWDKIWQAVNGLQSKVDSLNATAIEQQAQVSELQSKVNSLNTSLVELQTKVVSIEENLDNLAAESPRTIRFLSTAELQPAPNFGLRIGFSWYPQNATDNALLSVAFYMEYKGPSLSLLSTQIKIYDSSGGSWTSEALGFRCSEDYKWTDIQVPLNVLDYLHAQFPIKPNQDEYSFYVQVSGDSTQFIRNINVILTVVDGLPANG